MNKAKYQLLVKNLHAIINEMEIQTSVAKNYSKDSLSLEQEVLQIKEFVDAGECDLAYQSIIANLESIPLTLSGSAAVKLLETALLMNS